MLVMQDTLHNSFEKPTHRAGPQCYESWENGPPQTKVTTTLPQRHYKLQSICFFQSFFQARSVMLDQPQGQNGEPHHLRATGRVRRGEADRGDCQTKQMQWRQTKKDSAYFKGIAVPILQSSPCEPLHTFYKTLDMEDHKNEAHHSLDVFRHVQSHHGACLLFYLDFSSYFLPQAPSYA